MGFGEAIKVCFSKYADFTGRARRSEYWWFYLFQQLVALPVAFIFAFLAMAAFVPVLSQADANGNIPESALDDVSWGPFVIGVVLMLALWLVFLLPSLAVTVRRLHDSGRSGWWLLLAVIPIVNSVGGIVVLVFTILDSEPGTNAYGPNPKGAEWGYTPMTPPPAPGQTPPTSSDPFQA